MLKLYRFETASNERIEAILNRKIWLSKPSEFNDLNDCRIPALYLPEMDLHTFHELKKIINQIYPEDFDYSRSILSRKIIHSLKKYIENSEENDTLKQILVGASTVTAIRNEITSKTGVCCFFAGEINEPLLWAHYANKHTGFCVQYEFDEEANYSSLYPVNYMSELYTPSVREFAFCPEETLHKILTSKTIHWQYEKEYRLIEPFAFNDGENGKLIDIPDCLKVTRIIAGSRMEAKYYEELKDLKIEIARFRDIISNA